MSDRWNAFARVMYETCIYLASENITFGVAVWPLESKQSEFSSLGKGNVCATRINSYNCFGRRLPSSTPSPLSRAQYKAVRDGVKKTHRPLILLVNPVIRVGSTSIVLSRSNT